MLGIDKICIHISCGAFLTLIKELNLLRVLQFVSDCDGVNASSTDTETVSFTAPYTTLLPKDLAHLPSPPPAGRGHILQDKASKTPSVGASCPQCFPPEQKLCLIS